VDGSGPAYQRAAIEIGESHQLPLVGLQNNSRTQSFRLDLNDPPTAGVGFDFEAKLGREVRFSSLIGYTLTSWNRGMSARFA